MPKWAVIALLVVILGGCGDDRGTVVPSPGPTIRFSMTEEEFHDFGRLAGAAQPPFGASAAELLGMEPEEVRAQIQRICAGDPAATSLFPPLDWPAFPDDVPAYDQFFQEVVQACVVTATVQLPRLRASAAQRMASNQLFLERLTNPPENAVGSFCSVLGQNQNITSSVLASALESAEIIPKGSDVLAEVGVSLLIAYCPNLVRFLNSG